MTLIIDMTQHHVAVYTSERHSLLTTGVLIPFGLSDEDEIAALGKQLLPEIANMELCTEDQAPFLVRQVDHYSVHIKGLFAPIGRINIIALLDPGAVIRRFYDYKITIQPNFSFVIEDETGDVIDNYHGAGCKSVDDAYEVAKAVIEGIHSSMEDSDPMGAYHGRNE